MSDLLKLKAVHSEYFQIAFSVEDHYCIYSLFV